MSSPTNRPMVWMTLRPCNCERYIGDAVGWFERGGGEAWLAIVDAVGSAGAA